MDINGNPSPTDNSILENRDVLITLRTFHNTPYAQHYRSVTLTCMPTQALSQPISELRRSQDTRFEQRGTSSPSQINDSKLRSYEPLGSSTLSLDAEKSAIARVFIKVFYVNALLFMLRERGVLSIGRNKVILAVNLRRECPHLNSPFTSPNVKPWIV
ncbi:hypothetical protein NPIL_93581 [Nephila pilipes]|uniref:Uncharacterized protein n=1 Tax=Nephila pilipes TaxID=299642 RepID=A0A8X6K369_NEPPI|nr:hypothetical protein NPIL_93581 [Nephila pilipes]